MDTQLPASAPLALATHSTSLTLNLIVCLGGHQGYCVCGADVEWHITWIKSLQQSLPHVRNICVRLDLQSSGCINTTPEWTVIIEALPNCTELKLVGSTSLDSIGSADKSLILTTWTKQHGLQEDHEAIELYRERQADINAAG